MGKSLEEIKKIPSSIKHRLNLPISKGSNHPFSSWQKSQDDIGPLWDLATIYCVLYVCFWCWASDFLAAGLRVYCSYLLGSRKEQKVQFPKIWRDETEYEWHTGREVWRRSLHELYCIFHQKCAHETDSKCVFMEMWLFSYCAGIVFSLEKLNKTTFKGKRTKNRAECYMLFKCPLIWHQGASFITLASQRFLIRYIWAPNPQHIVSSPGMDNNCTKTQ